MDDGSLLLIKVLTTNGAVRVSQVLEGGGTAELMESLKRKQQQQQQQQQRCKRPGKMEKEKVPLKKRRKKEEEEGVLYSSNTDTLMTQVKQVDTAVCGISIENVLQCFS